MKKGSLFLYNKTMNNLHIISPYNDKELQINNESGRYELTLAYVKKNFEVTFRDDGVLQRRITKNSRKIYNYIFSHSNSYNNAVVNFCLFKTEEGRKWIKDILTEQMEADLESGYNDLSSTPAINVANGGVIDRNQLSVNQITIDTEQIIDRSADYFGFNLMYQSQFPAGYFLWVMQNSKKGK